MDANRSQHGSRRAFARGGWESACVTDPSSRKILHETPSTTDFARLCSHAFRKDVASALHRKHQKQMKVRFNDEDEQQIVDPQIASDFLVNAALSHPAMLRFSSLGCC